MYTTLIALLIKKAIGQSEPVTEPGPPTKTD